MTRVTDDPAARRVPGLERAELLLALWQVLTTTSDLRRAVRATNRRLRQAGAGIAVDEVLTGPAARRLVGPSRRLVIEPDTRSASVPVLRGRRLAGALRITLDASEGSGRGARGEVDGELLASLADMFAVVLERVSAKATLSEGPKRIASVGERHARTLEAWQVADGALVHAAQGVLDALAHTPESRLRTELAAVLADVGRAHRALRHGVGGLVLPGARRGDLAHSLRSLAGALRPAGGSPVSVRVAGNPVALERAVEDAVFDLVLHWVLSARFDGRASSVVVALTYDPRALVVRIRDDGVGLVHRPAFGGPWSIRGIQLAAEQSGASFGAANRTPRGVEVTATFGHPGVTPP